VSKQANMQIMGSLPPAFLCLFCLFFC